MIKHLLHKFPVKVAFAPINHIGCYVHTPDFLLIVLKKPILKRKKNHESNY